MKLVVLGFALPSERYDRMAATDGGMSAQTQRFGTSLLRAFNRGGATPKMVAAAPAKDFPHNSKVVFRRFSTTEKGIDYREIGFLNLTVAKHVTRFLNAVQEGDQIASEESIDALVVHGVHSAFLAAALVLRRRFGFPIVAVLTDPPNVPHQFDNALTRWLKRADAKFIRALLRQFDGVVTLTAQLARDFAPGVPHLVMEGMVPDPVHGKASTKADSFGSPLPVALYAGGISESYGVGLLKQAQEILAGRVQVIVYGRGPLVESLSKSESDEDSITYGGMLTPDELWNRYAQASVLVNPRPVNQEFVPYSFPSKIMEYIASGTPVVSTKLPGIPEEYWQFIFPADDTPQGLAEAILDVVGNQFALECANTGKAWINEYKSPLKQGRRMLRFISTLEPRSGQRSEGSS